MTQYTLTLGQAFVHTHNYIIINKEKLSDEEIKRLRRLKEDLECAKKWSSRLWNNFKYLTK